MNIPGRKYFYNESVYSDWAPRGGDNVIIRAELISDYLVTSSDTQLTINVYTKNSEEDSDTDGVPVKDSGGSNYAITFSVSDTAPLVKEFVVESATHATETRGLLELVRLKCTVSVGATGDASEHFLARIFPPIFFDAAK